MATIIAISFEMGKLVVQSKGVRKNAKPRAYAYAKKVSASCAAAFEHGVFLGHRKVRPFTRWRTGKAQRYVIGRFTEDDFEWQGITDARSLSRAKQVATATYGSHALPCVGIVCFNSPMSITVSAVAKRELRGWEVVK